MPDVSASNSFSLQLWLLANCILEWALGCLNAQIVPRSSLRNSLLAQVEVEPTNAYRHQPVQSGSIDVALFAAWAVQGS